MQHISNESALFGRCIIVNTEIADVPLRFESDGVMVHPLRGDGLFVLTNSYV